MLTGGNRKEVRFLTDLREYKNELTVAILIVVIFCISPFLTPVFLTSANLLNLLRQTSYTAIAAIGMYFVILTGGIDLSIGAEIQIIGMASISMLVNGSSTTAALLVSLGLGLLIGIINGTLVTFGKLQPFIVTLVTKRIMEGIVLTVTNGASVSGDVPDSFMRIGTGYISVFPVPVIVLFVCIIGTVILMEKMTYGRRLYLTGSNSKAAYYSGVSVKLIRMSAYILCSVFVMISGILSVARIGAFQPTTTHGGANGMEMNAIAAVVVGGGALSGGRGTIIGAVLGALLYGALANLFPLIGVNSYFQMLIQGLIILVAVIISSRNASKGRIRRKKGDANK